MEKEERSLEEIFGSYIGGAEGGKGRRVPFKFLDPYEAEDTDIFFGREEEVKELYKKYFSSNLLLLYGESGTGKTSLLRCGLLTQIPSSDLLLIHLKNSASAFEALEAELHRHLGERASAGRSLLENFRELHRLKRKPIGILFDQFEEVFIFQPEEARREMIAQVKSWLDSDLDIRVLFVIRKEFLADLTEFEAVLPSLFQNRVWVRKMDASQAEEAIAGPCRVCRVGIDKDLVSKLLKHLQAEGREVDLPNLQVLMDRLYRRAADRDPEKPEITMADYEALGRIENILASFLDERIAELKDPDLGKALLKLAVTSDGTKKPISEGVAAQMLSVGRTSEAAEQIPTLLATFERARILRRRPDGTFELRHDVLAKTIYSWMSETEKEIIEIRQLIENRYSEYQKRNTLLDREALELITPYKAKLGISADQKEFIQASKEAQRERIKRRRMLIAAILSAIILILSGFTFWNFKERKKTESAKQESDLRGRISQARYLFSQALLNTDNEKAPAFLAGALRSHPIAESMEMINTVVAKMEGQFQIPRQTIKGHEGGVRAAKFSPDGKLLASGSYDNTIRLWNILTGEVRILKGHEGIVSSVGFSPDGTSLASVSGDNTMRLWDIRTGKVLIFKGYEGASDIAFSPDGTMLACTSWDKTVRLCDIRTGETKKIKGHLDRAWAVAFSPDGTMLASASYDKTIRLWNLLTGEVRILIGHEGIVSDVAFSPDGTLLASASDDKTVRLWNVRTEKHMLFKGHKEKIWAVAFSPDSSLLASASNDKTVRLWDVRSGEARVLKGHEADVLAVAFSPDGTLLASASVDSTIRVWYLLPNCYFQKHQDSIWRLGRFLSMDEMLFALDSFTNLRYDPKTDTVEALPFKGIPKEWQK
jgi:WD40 repeat protein